MLLAIYADRAIGFDRAVSDLAGAPTWVCEVSTHAPAALPMPGDRGMQLSAALPKSDERAQRLIVIYALRFPSLLRLP